MAKANKKIRGAINWLMELDQKKKENTLEHLKLNALFRLNDERLENIKVIREYVADLIFDGTGEDEIAGKLEKLGLDQETSIELVSNINTFMVRYNESAVVSSLDISRFTNVIDFIINNVFIYNEYDYIPYNEFVEMFDFKNSNEATTTLRFINSHILMVAGRKVSIDTLRKILVKQYELSVEQTNIFIEKITENIVDIRQAYILDEIMRIKTKLDENIQDLNEDIEV